MLSLKQKTNHKQSNNILRLTSELVFIVTINKLVHKLLQMFIIIKQSSIEIKLSCKKFKYNTNYSKVGIIEKE